MIVKTLTCDRCGHPGPSTSTSSDGWLQQVARERGWKVDRSTGTHVCPKCRLPVDAPTATPGGEG